MYVNKQASFACDTCLLIKAAERPTIDFDIENPQGVTPEKEVASAAEPIDELTVELIPSENSVVANAVIEEEKEVAESANADKILIRRLQAQITKISEEHMKKELVLETEISTLKEAYRVCIAKYEKEKETKDTLQECLKVLQAQDRTTPTQVNNIENPVTKDENEAKIKERTPTLCRFFNRRTGCKFKDQCRYVHQPTNPQPNNIISPDKNNENKSKAKRPCSFFNRKSGCKFGEQCRFSHEVDTKEPQQYQKKACRFFNTERGCKKGENCTFLHNPIEENPFLSTISKKRPPDTTDLMNDIKELIKLQISQEMNRHTEYKQQGEVHNNTHKNMTNQNLTRPEINSASSSQSNNLWMRNDHQTCPPKAQLTTNWTQQNNQVPMTMYQAPSHQSYQYFHPQNQPITMAQHSLY